LNEQRFTGFLQFVDKVLELYLTVFYENQHRLSRMHNLSNYRASLYYHPLESDNLLFLTGVSPQRARHSRQPLPYKGSVAGAALRQPGQLHHYAGNNDEEFFQRPVDRRYAYVYSYALPRLKKFDKAPYLVLNIDAMENVGERDAADLEKKTEYIAYILSYIQQFLAITRDDIDQYQQDVASAS
jgi:hypothetical protein